MKNPFTLHQILGYFMPGFMFIFILFCWCNDWQWDKINAFNLSSINGANATILSVVAIIISIFIGLIFDSIRNGYIEDYFDLEINNKLLKKILYKKFFNKIEWEYFQDMEASEKEKVYGRYYSYYVFDMNTIIGFFIIFISIIIIKIFNCTHFTCNDIAPFIILIIIFIMLLRDSASLRKEISDITNNKNNKK